MAKAKVQTYGSEVRLFNNQRYTVKFTLGSEQKTFTFTSRYTPLYSTVKIIRNDFPDLFEEIKDDTINFQIWQSSILVNELFLENDTTVDTATYAMKQYVRYKTEYDIVRNIMIALGTEAGVNEKHLGEFKVSKEVKTPDFDPILKALKAELIKWEASAEIGPQTTSAVRAGGTTFPLAGRVSF